jgi:hypothetical protein
MSALGVKVSEDGDKIQSATVTLLPFRYFYQNYIGSIRDKLEKNLIKLS